MRRSTPSALTQSDGSGIAASFFKIDAADAVHSNGLYVLLQQFDAFVMSADIRRLED